LLPNANLLRLEPFGSNLDLNTPFLGISKYLLAPQRLSGIGLKIDHSLVTFPRSPLIFLFLFCFLCGQRPVSCCPFLKEQSFLDQSRGLNLPILYNYIKSWSRLFLNITYFVVNKPFYKLYSHFIHRFCQHSQN
jgi:hypothetical protein